MCGVVTQCICVVLYLFSCVFADWYMYEVIELWSCGCIALCSGGVMKLCMRICVELWSCGVV